MKETGSTFGIPIGKPFDQLIKIVSNILQFKLKSTGINTKCGAGPLKMARWKNG